MNEPFNDNNNNEPDKWENPYSSNNSESYHPPRVSRDEANSYDHQKVAPSYQTENKYSEIKVNQQAKSKNTIIIIVSIIAAISILIIGLGSYFVYNQFISKGNIPFASSSTEHSGTGIDPNAEPLPVKDLTGDEDGLTADQIYKNNVESTVGIVVYDTSSNIIATEKSQGTGIILSSDGYIVTNSHVIANSKKSNVTVVLNDEREIPGTVVGYDVRTDIAVVKIEETGLKAAEFGNSDQLSVGQWVIAIGNPGGLDFVNSLTRGVVSAVNRSLGASNLVKYIQTDAAINPGNSGGPLIDMYGRVVGITSSKISATGYEGMGFAIPTNTMKTVVDDIITKGYVTGRAYLGIAPKEISAYVAQMYGVPQGVLIGEILQDSCLTGKNAKAGDIITKVGENSVTSISSLYNELAAYSPGDKVKLTLYRMDTRFRSNSNSTFEIEVTLIEDKGQSQIQESSQDSHESF